MSSAETAYLETSPGAGVRNVPDRAHRVAWIFTPTIALNFVIKPRDPDQPTRSTTTLVEPVSSWIMDHGLTS
jgi:hypothetical protein